MMTCSTSTSLYIISNAQTGITLMRAVPSYTRVSKNVSWALEENESKWNSLMFVLTSALVSLWITRGVFSWLSNAVAKRALSACNFEFECTAFDDKGNELWWYASPNVGFNAVKD